MGDLKDLIQELILEFQESSISTGIPRRLDVKPVSGKATVCIGVRRSGKSTYMLQIIKKLIENGVNRKNIFYLNFFDDRLHSLTHEGIGIVSDAYYALYPEKKNREKVYFFFDEIQVITGWESFIDRLMRTEDCEVYITGSSAQMLSREIASQMRGRSLSWEIFPFSFQEYLDYKQVDFESGLSSKKRLLVEHAFKEFWNTGGFPEVAGVDSDLRIRIHQDYFQAVLFRDMVERHNISHPRALLDLAHWLINHTGSLYSVNKLCGYLKSLGHRTPKSSVSEYLQWFEDAYFLFTVPIYDASPARVNTNPKKIYCIDHSLVTSISPGILTNKGHLLENLVFTSLRRTKPDIFYYKTSTGREIDFITLPKGKSRSLFQVSASMAEQTTRKREVQALQDAMKELKLKSSTIVTWNEEEQVDGQTGRVNIVPVWKWLLKGSE